MKNKGSRLTIEIVKERYKNSNLKLLSETYVNNHTHLQWECKTCGYQFPRSLGKIQASQRCDACAGTKAITIESITKYVEDKPVTLLSTVYTGNSGSLAFACTVEGCNKVFPRSWAKLRESHSCPRCEGYEKITVEAVIDFFKEIPVKLLSTEYTNQDTELTWECLEDACHSVFNKSYANMKKSACCDSCSSHGKLNLNIVKERLGKIRIKVVSDVYEDRNTEMVVACAHEDCKQEWKTTFNKIMKDKDRCLVHFGIKKYTIASIKQKLTDDNRNIELLSSQYDNAQQQLDWRCLVPGCDHTWPASAGSVLSNGSGCGNCARNTTHSIQRVKEKLIENKILLECIEGVYVNNKSVLQWRCLNPRCNKTFPKSWDKILHRDKGCLFCKPKGRGTANKTIVERDPEYYLNVPCVVYVIKCNSSTESFYKIGLTQNKLSDRINTYPYDCEVLKVIETNKYDAVYIEADLQEFHREAQYTPMIDFRGRRECFSHIHIRV